MNPELEFDDATKERLTDIKYLRSKLKRKVPFVLAIIVIHRILVFIDPHQDFNPTFTMVFDLLVGITAVLALTYLLFDHVMKEIDLERPLSHRLYKLFHGVLDYIVIIPYLVFVVTVMNMFVFSFSPISGTSMAPSYADDEAVIFSHLANDYERYDVIILYEESLTDPYLIKRVIGLPGETVEIKLGRVYIDGILLAEPYIDDAVVETTCVQTNGSSCTFVVGEDEYFVLGDNRDGQALPSERSGYSVDSRTFGMVEKQNIFGKVIFQFRDFNVLN
ncbi:MAG: signal peptidase I [Candidatus Izimaplasma sp.]|nr:signal peptidase I [Candidatus Izimaplasma bacterium]